MLVIPSIDIRGGKCVRLTQGDYARETIYDDDPVAVARRWQDEGASLIHVVDLDGAKAGAPVNLDVVERVVSGVDVPVQLGGGLRQWEDIARALGAGVARVVLGTAALEDRDLLQKAIAELGERLVVGIDARDGKVATRGWRETSTVTATELARDVEGLGVQRLVFTDIARDGTLSEPNYASLSAMMGAVRIPVIASGGVARLEHIGRLAALGVEGAIVGRALYTGNLRLSEAIALATARQD